jgi:hypothetical protein
VLADHQQPVEAAAGDEVQEAIGDHVSRREKTERKPHQRSAECSEKGDGERLSECAKIK